jgi:hypothetical protein
MIGILTLLMFLFNVGRLLAQRERTRMQTDVSAMSGAVIYARCLNFYSLVKKVDQGSEAASLLVGWFPWGGEFVDAFYEIVDEIKSEFQEFSPYLVLGCTEWTSIQNGLLAVPYWNVKDFFDPDANVQGFTPSLNFDTDEDSSSTDSGSSVGNAGSSSDHYSYHQKSDGDLIQVDNSQVSQDQNGGATGSYRDSQTGRFVHRDQGSGGQAEGEHSITLLTYDLLRPTEKLSAGMKDLPHFISISKARVAGGNFDFSSSSSLQWGAFLAPVTVKDPSQDLPDLQIPSTGIGAIDSLTQEANNALQTLRQWLARVPIILH